MFEKNKKLLCVNLIFEENDKNLEQVVNRIENSIDFKNG
jgi:exonuclease VII small subunit